MHQQTATAFCINFMLLLNLLEVALADASSYSFCLVLVQRLLQMKKLVRTDPERSS
jgi:hypothetical protein